MRLKDKKGRSNENVEKREGEDWKCVDGIEKNGGRLKLTAEKLENVD